MKLTFGKFKGWATSDLARAGSTGRGYLAWGAENLRSPKWREEFQRALGAPTDQDLHLTALALSQGEDDLSYDEAMIFARDEAEEAKEHGRFSAALDQAQAEVLAEWAGKLGQGEDRLRALAGRLEFVDLAEVPVSRFSSPAAKVRFGEFLKAWLGAYDRAGEVA